MRKIKIWFDFVKHFKNQIYILAVIIDKASKVILFWKINRFLRSTTQGLKHRDLIKK